MHVQRLAEWHIVNTFAKCTSETAYLVTAAKGSNIPYFIFSLLEHPRDKFPADLKVRIVSEQGLFGLQGALFWKWNCAPGNFLPC